MINLTKLWSNFKHVHFDRNRLHLTHRLLYEKIEDPDQKDPPLSIGINTLSGSIDIFTQKEAEYLEKLISQKSSVDIPDQFLFKLRDQGYIFPSREVEELVFNAIIHKYKCLKNQTEKILGFFAIDMGCSMQCEYCFEKKYEKQSGLFEKSVMNQESLIAAFNALDMFRTVQNKEVDFVAGWGGEPLQEKNSVINEQFIALAKQRGLSIAYFSNLAQLEDRLFTILKNNAAHFKFIQTTLDATQVQHDQYRKMPHAFDKTVSSIHQLLQMGLPIVVRTNVGPHNMKIIPELADFYQSKGWFDFPNFKCFITKTYDRHHDFEKKITFTEDEAMSSWLRLNDEFPIVRKMQTMKFAPSLYPILKAFKIRERLDLIRDDFEVSNHPMLTYCYTGRRSEYVFTGAPNHSIYNCAECTGISNFKIGTYLPTISFAPEQRKLWDIPDNFFTPRSIDRLKECNACRGATFCGGYCALESITANGSADEIHCKQTPTIISNFLKNESARFYRRSRSFIECTNNLTL